MTNNQNEKGQIMIKKIRQKQYAEGEFRQIKAIAEGGEVAASFHLMGQGYPRPSAARSRYIARQCGEFLERVKVAWWKKSGRFYVVTMDANGPGVEVIL